MIDVTYLVFYERLKGFFSEEAIDKLFRHFQSCNNWHTFIPSDIIESYAEGEIVDAYRTYSEYSEEEMTEEDMLDELEQIFYENECKYWYLNNGMILYSIENL